VADADETAGIVVPPIVFALADLYRSRFDFRFSS